MLKGEDVLLLAENPWVAVVRGVVPWHAGTAAQSAAEAGQGINLAELVIQLPAA